MSREEQLTKVGRAGFFSCHKHRALSYALSISVKLMTPEMPVSDANLKADI